MDRRVFLKAGLGVSASTFVAGLPRPRGVSAAPTAEGKWRTFEVTTRAEVADAGGITRVWLPLGLMPQTEYFKNLGQTWTGNAEATRIYRDEKYGAAIFYAEWPKGVAAPAIEVTSTFATRDRAVDLSTSGERARGGYPRPRPLRRARRRFRRVQGAGQERRHQQGPTLPRRVLRGRARVGPRRPRRRAQGRAGGATRQPARQRSQGAPGAQEAL